MRAPINKELVWRVLDKIPLLIPIAIASFGVVAITLLLLNAYETVLVVLLGGAAAIVSTFFAYRHLPYQTLGKEGKITLVLALLITGIWVGVNTFYGAEHIHTNRDPATYTVASMWLTDNSTLNIPKTDALSGIEDIRETSAGFASSKDDESIQAQGNHLLPALMAIAGRVAGEGAILHAGPVFGGVMLLAVFGFARLLVRGRWALVALMALAASLPLIYFSRDIYTEPLTGALVFGALGLLYLADKTKRPALWFFAGLVIGAAALVRIDATLAQLGVLAGAATMLLLAKPGERKRSAWHFLLFLVPLVAVSLLGWLDVSELSTHYYETQYKNILPQYLVAAAALVAVAISWAAVVLGRSTFERLEVKTRGWRVQVAVAFVVLFALVLASRPFWFIGHRGRPISLTEVLQARFELPIDALRDYSEQTINWMIWYIGPVLVVAALIGVALVVKKALETRQAVWVALLATVLATALLYFVAPNITPDQVWASRRFLPVIIPGIAVLGVLGLSWLSTKKLPYGLNSKVIATVLATLAVSLPFTTTHPLLQARELQGQYGQLHSICGFVGKDAVVLWAGPDSSLTMTQPTRTICDVPAYGMQKQAAFTDDILQDAFKKAQDGNKKLFIGKFTYEDIASIDNSNLVSVSSIEYDIVEQTLIEPPKTTIVNNREVLMLEVDESTVNQLYSPSERR
jgi:hypothetical protein